MKDNSPQPYNESEGKGEERTSNNPNAQKLDLSDSPRDKERLKPDETTIELPDVKDIPGQEFVNVPPMGGLADTTISSADEEGEGLFVDDEEDETDIVMGTEADIPEDDKKMLETGEELLPTADDSSLRAAALDSTDFEGETLNEGSFGVGEVESATDLDTNVGPDETRTTSLGQGDEENKEYSLGSADNDNVTEGTP